MGKSRWVLLLVVAVVLSLSFIIACQTEEDDDDDSGNKKNEEELVCNGGEDPEHCCVHSCGGECHGTLDTANAEHCKEKAQEYCDEWSGGNLAEWTYWEGDCDSRCYPWFC